MQYMLQFPNIIRFGRNTFAELSALIPARGNILLVTGKHALRSGLANRGCALLGEERTFLYSDVHAELPLRDVEALLELGRKHQVQCVVAIGGGSVIDAGKSAAQLMYAPGSVSDYFYARLPLPEKRCFFAALPTTSGTGAEITPNAVLHDPASGIKQSIRRADMFADVALIDPALTDDCPAMITAASAFDSFTQCVESYISRKANHASQALALEAAKLVFPALSKLGEPDEAMRDRLAEGTMLGAMAFISSGLGAVHGIGHPAGCLSGFAHGVACAVLLPTVLRRNAPNRALEELALILTGKDTNCFIAEIERLRTAAKLPSDFKSAGLTREHLDFIVKNCRSGSMKSNPRDFDDATVYEILEELT